MQPHKRWAHLKIMHKAGDWSVRSSHTVISSNNQWLVTYSRRRFPTFGDVTSRPSCSRHWPHSFRLAKSYFYGTVSAPYSDIQSESQKTHSLYQFHLQLRTVLFWVFMQHKNISCRRFGTTYWSNFRGSSSSGTDTLYSSFQRYAIIIIIIKKKTATG
jgi:hypothetical protein